MVRLGIGILGLLAVTVAGLAITVAVYFYGDDAEPLVLKERWALRWDALDVADQSLDLASADGWTAMAGINDAAIDTAFEAIEGTKLVNTEDGAFEGVEIVLNDVDITPGLGAMDAALALTASRGDLKLGLVLEGVVLVHGIENGTKEIDFEGEKRAVRESRVTLRIDPVRIATQLGEADLERKEKSFWSDLAPGLVSLKLPDELLSTTFPLQAEFLQKIGIDETRHQVLDETTNASVDYRISMPADEIRIGVAYGAPIYTESAVWLMAREVDNAPPDILPRQRPEGTAEGLEAAARALDSQVQSKLGSEQEMLRDVTTARIALVVDDSLLTDIRSVIMDLPADRRQLSVKLTNRSGKLAEDVWKNKLMGDGGAYVEIGCADCGSLQARLSDLRFDTGGDAWKASVSIAAEAEGSLHAHFDPHIGGGAGSRVGVEGKTQGAQTVSAALRPKVLSSVNGHQAAVLEVSPSCERIELIATTDGKLKFDVGWMSMPKVGARMFVPVGTAAVEPVLIMATEPAYIYWGEPMLVSGTEEAGGWELTLPNLASVITAAPARLELAGGKMHAAVDLTVRHVPTLPAAAARAAARTELEAEQAAAAQAAQLETEKLLDGVQGRGRCEDVNPGMRILIGSFEFGPNNEFVKFFRNAWNDLTIGPGEGNEIVKFLDGAGETFHQADAIARGIVDGVLDEGGKVLAYGAEAARKHTEAAAKEAERLRREATKEAERLVREAEKLLPKPPIRLPDPDPRKWF